MGNKYFDRALANFTQDIASGGAIRHLADLGYTVEEIVREIDFPTPRRQVAQMVWEHYVKRGIILMDVDGLCFEEPDLGKEGSIPLRLSDGAVAEKVSYVKEYGKYGTTTLRRVAEIVENPAKEYYPCDFGKQRYQDECKFKNGLEVLSERDREYILGLPWPLQRVYHVADERMRRVMQYLYT